MELMIFAGFKALSRMSSSPTLIVMSVRGLPRRFQSAVAHELFSDIVREMKSYGWVNPFQSAVAHELFSDRRT